MHVSVRGLKKSYNTLQVLKGIDLDIEKGEVVLFDVTGHKIRRWKVSSSAAKLNTENLYTVHDFIDYNLLNRNKGAIILIKVKEFYFDTI